MNAGDVVQKRYRLEERLGKGGMGEVWRAHDQRLEREVAIKVISPQFADDPEFLVRFLREAQSIARISHPNVVGVLDFGEDSERPFLVMEYVPGRPLGEMTGEPMEPDRATAIMVQAAAAAGAAHAQGIVHRDIKPANILITEDGRAKLVDFGIASAEGVERLTATGTTIGSPHYISPEQAQGHKATPRSDVYALGVVLFELLAGRRPFEGGSVAAIAGSHVEDPAGVPSDHVGGIAPELDAIVARCLAKPPEDRFQDGSELAEALDTGTDARTRVVPAAVGAGGDTMVLGAGTASFDPGDDDADRDSPWKAILLGLLVGLVLLALVVGAVALLGSDDEPPSSPAEAPTRRDRPETSEPTEEVAPTEEDIPPETEEPVIEETTTPPEETPEEEPEEDEESEGQGPEGEGPPGHEKKAEEKEEKEDKGKE